MLKSFDEIIKYASEIGSLKVAVACAQDEDVMMSLEMEQIYV